MPDLLMTAVKIMLVGAGMHATIMNEHARAAAAFALAACIE
jgi:hypothetical protein